MRFLVLACVLSLSTASEAEGQITKPTRLPTLDPTALVSIQSLSVKDGVISLIGTHGASVVLPDGTFKGPSGASIIVVTGRITRYAPPSLTSHKLRPRSELPLLVSGSKMEDGQLFLIGTDGRRATLGDGTYTNADGAKIVVQNRSITRVSGG